MLSIRYKLTAFLFKRMVRPMMKKAATEPERFLEEQCKARQKKKLPLATLHKKYDFDEKATGDTPYYVFRFVVGRLALSRSLRIHQGTKAGTLAAGKARSVFRDDTNAAVSRTARADEKARSAGCYVSARICRRRRKNDDAVRRGRLFG